MRGKVLRVGWRQEEDLKDCRSNTQAHTVPRLTRNIVLGRLDDGKMERSPLHIRTLAALPSHPKPPTQTEGSTLGATKKNKAIHCCFTPGSAKPQAPHSWLLTLSCLAGLRHTPLCQCLVQKCGGKVHVSGDLSYAAPKTAKI